jgi:hypothetical protein
VPPTSRRYPEHCQNTLIETARRTGISHFLLLVEGTGDRARTLENIARLGAEVIPSCRSTLHRGSQ